MTRSPFHRRLAFLLVATVAFSTAGCVPMERRNAVRVDFEPLTTEENGAGGALPETPFLLPDPSLTGALPDEHGVLTLSVEQAVVGALENNADLRVRRYGPLIAGTFERIERGVYDPEMFAEFSIAASSGERLGDTGGRPFFQREEAIQTEAGVRQRLPYGTTLEAQVGHDRNVSNRDFESQAARVGIGVTQALLRGFGPAVNLASVQQAKLDTLASEYELRAFAESLAADTEKAYWAHVLAEQKLGIFQRSVAVARQQRDEIVQRIEVGLLPENEAAAARAELARNEQALIDAKSLLERRRLELVQVVNPDGNGRLDRRIEAVSRPEIEPLPIDEIEERMELAERMRADINEARLRIQQRRLELVRTRNGLLPKLDLFILLGKTGYADRWPEGFMNLDDDGFDLSAGIRLSAYLQNRSAKARDLAARLSRDQAQNALTNLRQLVRLDVLLAVNEAERTRQQISATKETRRYLEQTLASEKQRFDVGLGTALEVARALRDLLAGQIGEVEAIIDHRLALVDLYVAEGSLLERRGITLAGDAGGRP